MKKYCFALFLSMLWAFPMASQYADLSLVLSVDDNLVDIGQTVTFTIVVTNDGPSMARGVLVMDKLPSGYQFVSADPAMGTYNHVSGIWTIGNLGNGVSAVLTISAMVENATDLNNLAEVIASNLRDYDSVPNNGVDTDGDGNAFDDLDDEDDGDGQMVVASGSSTSSGNPPAGGTASGNDCLVPINELSSMAPNPQNIDATFKFDYKIVALLNFKMANTDGFSPEYSRGDPYELKMEYYVNSADGSMMFPGGSTGFFKTNYSYSSALGDVDAAIWLPNGQMVIYGYEEDGKKRAVTRESIQTAQGRYQNDFLQIQRFIGSSLEWGEWREPLPSRVDWRGDVVGYKAELPDASTGQTNTWILYFNKAPTPIKTSVPMMGYMVGVLKDIEETQCNRLVVYSQILIGGPGTGDAIEVELKSIRPLGITFDGTDYKPLTLGGDYGTPSFAKMDDYESKMRSIDIRRQTLERRKKRCPPNSICVERINAEMEALRKEKSEAICEQMVAMGMEDSYSECMREEGY